MDVNKFSEAARYMSIIQKYERDLELLERECNGAKLVLFKDGDVVCECCGDTVDMAIWNI